MGVLRYFIHIFIFIAFSSYLYANNSSEVIKKSINIQKSKKYQVNNFTNINIHTKKIQQTQKDKVNIEQKAEIIQNTESLPKPKAEKQVKIHEEIEKKQDYKSQLQHLQKLRYEVMSLKLQLGDEEQISVPYGNYIDKKTSAQRYNALTQSYDDALKKSGLFAGVSMGVLDIYTSGYRNNQFVMTRITPIVYGGSGGYQKFFNHYLGTRLYGGLFTSFFNDVYTYDIKNGESSVVQNPYGGSGNLESFYMLAFMSADLLFEFPLDNKFQHYIGGFMGLNIGIMYYRPYATHPQKGEYYPVSFLWNYNLQVDYSFNLGMSLSFFNNHRVELGLGIPFSYLQLPGFAESANTLETTTTNFWRSAVLLLNYRLLIKL